MVPQIHIDSGVAGRALPAEVDSGILVDVISIQRHVQRAITDHVSHSIESHLDGALHLHTLRRAVQGITPATRAETDVRKGAGRVMRERLHP